MNEIKKTAEELFKSNINKDITVRLISDNIKISGTLIQINCNTLIIKDVSGFINMCRYEDIQYLVPTER